MRMTKRILEIVGAVLALVLPGGGCQSLNISNPNAPDRKRALSDPATIQSVAQGAFQTWYETSQGAFSQDQYPATTLAVMARSHTAMWNNYNIRFYTGCTNTGLPWNGYTIATNGTCGPVTEGPPYPRVAWQNNPASAQRTQIEALWYGYYSSLSSANDVLSALRVNNVFITDSATTKMVETMMVLTQALDLSSIALNYDQGFIVDYNTNLNTLKFSPAKDIRDSAAARFDEAIALANANTFPVPGAFFGGSGGPAQRYTNVQIAQVANTMAARNLALFPRHAAQNADLSAGGLVDWAKVATYASKGISSGAPFNFVFHQDACNTWCDFLKVWTNDVTTMRVHTRVAHLMDPVTQPDPWDITLNTHPSSPDKRLGDGTSRWGLAYDTSVANAYPDTTGKGGSDFIWIFTQEFGNKSRGSWHQSAVGQTRYDSFPGCGDNPSLTQTPGALDGPYMLAAENDLLLAEAYIRSPTQNLPGAALLINRTRVGRGGLPPATAADANLLQELQYEQDVELIGSNDDPFYNQRRIDNLEPLTPHEMPVPAKELGVDQVPLYTCGGASHPDGSCDAHPTPSPALVAALVTDAPRVWAEMYQTSRAGLHLPGTKSSRQ